MPEKKVLICGATGFIGRNIVESFALMDQYEVTATHFNSDPFQIPGVNWVKADLTNHADVDRVVRGTEIIVQAAATTSGAKDIVTKPYYHVTDNAVMNSLLFRSAYENKVSHVVFFSCTVMYQSSDAPVLESDFDANQELFPNYFGVGWTKVYIEKMCQFYSRIGETQYTAIRHSNIYGPHDKFDLEKSHVFGATMTKVMTARDGKIVVWGTGEEARDLLYVSDLVDFVRLALERQEEPFELFNVGYGSAIAIRDLVGKIIEASGQELDVEHDLTKPTLKTSLSVDCAKAERVLSWSRQTSLDEGIKKTMDWYRENLIIN